MRHPVSRWHRRDHVVVCFSEADIIEVVLELRPLRMIKGDSRAKDD
jgi:hypothetical protein